MLFVLSLFHVDLNVLCCRTMPATQLYTTRHSLVTLMQWKYYYRYPSYLVGLQMLDLTWFHNMKDKKFNLFLIAKQFRRTN